MHIAMKFWLVAVALSLTVSTALAATVFPVAMHGRPLHGPPDAAQCYICKVQPRYVGGVCTAPPMRRSASAAPANVRTARALAW